MRCPPNGGKNPACSVGSERVQFDFGVREQKRRLLFTWSTSTWPLTHFLSWTSHQSRVVKLDPLTWPWNLLSVTDLWPRVSPGSQVWDKLESWADGHWSPESRQSPEICHITPCLIGGEFQIRYEIQLIIKIKIKIKCTPYISNQ